MGIDIKGDKIIIDGEEFRINSFVGDKFAIEYIKKYETGFKLVLYFRIEFLEYLKYLAKLVKDEEFIELWREYGGMSVSVVYKKLAKKFSVNVINYAINKYEFQKFKEELKRVIKIKKKIEKYYSEEMFERYMNKNENYYYKIAKDGLVLVFPEQHIRMIIAKNNGEVLVRFGSLEYIKGTVAKFLKKLHETRSIEKAFEEVYISIYLDRVKLEENEKIREILKNVISELYEKYKRFGYGNETLKFWLMYFL